MGAPVVVTIGYCHYLVASKKDATAVLTALAGAIKLERDYLPGHKEVYYPGDRQTEISVQTILPHQLLRTKPAEEDKPIEQPAPRMPKQLGFGGDDK